jgi:hypothetical protein
VPTVSIDPATLAATLAEWERRGLIDPQPAKCAEANHSKTPKGSNDPPLPQLLESEFQTQVIDLARLHGWIVAHFRPGLNARGKWQTAVQGDGAGFPDLVMIRVLGDRAEIIVAELKVSRNKPSDAQTKWIEAFRLTGIPTFCWWPSDWPQIVDRLTNHRLAA